MTAEKPNHIRLEELEQPSMTSHKTFEWLKAQGLDYSINWDAQNPKPVLLITTEKFRGHVVKNAPSLLVTSFVIVRNPISVSFSPEFKIYNTGISYTGQNQQVGRAYDVYSINPVNDEVLFVQPKHKDPRGISFFQTELPYLVIDGNNKEILRNLGCKFDW